MYMFCTEGQHSNAVHFIIFAAKKNPKYVRPHAFRRPHVFSLTPVHTITRLATKHLTTNLPNDLFIQMTMSTGQNVDESWRCF